MNDGYDKFVDSKKQKGRGGRVSELRGMRVKRSESERKMKRVGEGKKRVERIHA